MAQSTAHPRWPSILPSLPPLSAAYAHACDAAAAGVGQRVPLNHTRLLDRLVIPMLLPENLGMASGTTAVNRTGLPAWQKDLDRWPPNRSVITRMMSRKMSNEEARTIAAVPSQRAYGKLGCYLSHLRAFLDAKTRGFETIMVMEDDVIEATPGQFARQLLDAISSLPDRWDLLSMGYAATHAPCVNRSMTAGNTTADPNAFRLKGRCGRTPVCRAKHVQNNAAYVVHRRALDWLIPLLCAPLFQAAHDAEIMLPLDMTLQAHYVANDEALVYASRSPLVAQVRSGEAGQSSIGSTIQLIPGDTRRCVNRGEGCRTEGRTIH